MNVDRQSTKLGTYSDTILLGVEILNSPPEVVQHGDIGVCVPGIVGVRRVLSG